MVATVENSTYFKDHLAWLEIKKRLDAANHKPPLFQEQEIWWTSVGVNIGSEIDGKNKFFTRPVLVFKKLNQKIFLGIPLSTKNKLDPYYLPITVKGKTSSVIFSQIKCFSYKRLQDKLAKLDTQTYSVIKNQLRKLF